MVSNDVAWPQHQHVSGAGILRIRPDKLPRNHHGDQVALTPAGRPDENSWVDHDNSGDLVYAETTDDLLGEWIPGYHGADTSGRALLRAEHTVQIRDALVARLLVNSENNGITVTLEPEAILMADLDKMPDIQRWTRPSRSSCSMAPREVGRRRYRRCAEPTHDGQREQDQQPGPRPPRGALNPSVIDAIIARSAPASTASCPSTSPTSRLHVCGGLPPAGQRSNHSLRGVEKSTDSRRRGCAATTAQYR